MSSDQPSSNRQTQLGGSTSTPTTTASGVKRERTDSLKQLLPPPAAQRAKGKGIKPSPIVTTNLDHTPDTTPGSARGGDKSNPRRWSKAEDESLRVAVERSGERNWKAIADQVVGRNHTQCLQRWTKVLKPGLIKGHWTPEEDAKLRALVAEGRKNWGQVAGQIPGRTYVDTSSPLASFVSCEDQVIVDMQAKLGNRWSVIAQQLTGRTEDAVKIRWKSLMRTRRSSRDNAADDDSGNSDENDDQAAKKPPTTPEKPHVMAKARAKPATKGAVPPLSKGGTAPPKPATPTATSVRRHQPSDTSSQPPSFNSNGLATHHYARPPSADFLHEHPPPFHPPSTAVYKTSAAYPRMPFSAPSYPPQYHNPYEYPPPPAHLHHIPPPPPYLLPSQHPTLPSAYRLHAAAAREEWGTSSHAPQLPHDPAVSSEYDLFHQQRLRLMVQERERAGPTLSPAASPGQALLTKELAANSERQKRQAIMQNGWKHAAAASVGDDDDDASLTQDLHTTPAYIDQDDDDEDHHVTVRYGADDESHLAPPDDTMDDDDLHDDDGYRSTSRVGSSTRTRRHVVVALPPVE
ncbi:hypothetical protein DYB31_009601 [Aphanomyces astaci]|uniref:Uncharacterized protein n=1 Tax=Aphanomyces astaci TaxID=112090 RepID=A0A397ERX8_APHAT|nr:hypothetical protein DYB31_009601 [Aphanomyces astaci]